MANRYKLVIDLSKPKGERETKVKMTDQEIAEQDALFILNEEIEENRPLTAEERITLLEEKLAELSTKE